MRNHKMKRIIIVFLLLAAGLVRAGVAPLCAEELEALAFLEHVTGPLPAAEESDWWNIGGTRHCCRVGPSFLPMG